MSLLIMNVRRPDIKKDIMHNLKGLVVIFLLIFFSAISLKAIEIDLSKRNGLNIDKKSSSQDSVLVQALTSIADPVQPIVILNMGDEFIPNTIRLKKNGNYKFYVVNVNENNKNVSFVLDAFDQNHGTYFGKVKIFDVKPKVTGLFAFSCPETGIQGKIVIISDEGLDVSTVAH